MSIVVEIPWLFLIIAGFAGYFQTVTGFGLGIIVMGLTGALAIAPVASVAVVVSLMAMANCAMTLPRRLHYVDWPVAGATVLGMLPAIIGGVLLLNYLSDSNIAIVRVLLGVVILYAGANLLIKKTLQEKLSGRGSFVVFGALAGFLGGLFGVGGPPLVYHYYRQPLDPIRIRTTLILLFAASSSVRTLFVISQGDMTLDILLLAAWAFPMVAIGTVLGRYYPPRWSALTMRRVVFTVLILIGLRLIVGELLP